MASRYLPPQLRNKKETGKVAPVVEEVKPVEDSFPALSNVNAVQVSQKHSGRSFATLASDWAKHSDREKEEDDLKKRYHQTLEEGHRHSAISLPKFHNVRHFVEPEDDEQEETKPPATNTDEEGWIEVRHKKRNRRPKTFEEKLAEDELNQEEPPKEETVWNTEDDETYWKH